MTTENQTVAEIATERPASLRVFHRHGIDFCCGGHVPVAQACEKRGLDLEQLLGEIAEEEAQVSGEPEAWQSRPLGELVDHIVTHYHRPLDEELPRLEQLARKVARVHGERHPELKPLLEAYLELSQDLAPHMMKEEQVLFPAIQNGQSGFLPQPVEAMQMEHEAAGELLGEIRELTGGFTVPDDACGSFRALWLGLADLERSLHEHIHLENNILFSRALRE